MKLNDRDGLVRLVPGPVCTIVITQCGRHTGVLQCVHRNDGAGGFMYQFVCAAGINFAVECEDKFCNLNQSHSLYWRTGIYFTFRGYTQG